MELHDPGGRPATTEATEAGAATVQQACNQACNQAVQHSREAAWATQASSSGFSAFSGKFLEASRRSLASARANGRSPHAESNEVPDNATSRHSEHDGSPPMVASSRSSGPDRIYDPGTAAAASIARPRMSLATASMASLDSFGPVRREQTCHSSFKDAGSAGPFFGLSSPASASGDVSSSGRPFVPPTDEELENRRQQLQHLRGRREIQQAKLQEQLKLLQQLRRASRPDCQHLQPKGS